MFGPSLRAESGAGWVSKKSPSAPMATAARAKRFHHAPIAAGDRAKPPGLLDTMGGVKDHRNAQRLHLGDGPQIVDQSPIAEEGAAFAEEDIPTAGSLEFTDDVLHVSWGEELAFLHVDGASGLGRGHEQVGLPSEKGGDLEQITDLGRPAPLAPEDEYRS